MKKPLVKATINEKQHILSLQKRIASESPSRGYAPPLNQKVSFRSLPISDATLRGLEEGDGKNKKNTNDKNVKNESGGKSKNKKNASNKKQFLIMTDIQNACIPHALRGRDILGAARTGRLVCSDHSHCCLLVSAYLLYANEPFCCSCFINCIIIFYSYHYTISRQKQR